MIYIGNVFTGGFIASHNWKADCKTITWKEFDEFAQGEHVNFFGHKDVAKMCGFEMNRISIAVEDGDIVVVAQYDGPRLPEGCTELPEGATLVPVKIEIKIP